MFLRKNLRKFLRKSMWKSLKKDLQKLPVENRIIKKTKKPKKTGTR